MEIGIDFRNMRAHRPRHPAAILFAIVITVGLLSVPSSAPAERSAQLAPSSPTPVTLFVTVRDRGGQLVDGMAQGDFRVFEDGKEQQVVSFSRAESRPLALGLLMQWSGQRRDTLPYAEVDTDPRLLQSLVTPNNSVFAAGYTDKVTLFSDFANDPVELTGRLRMAPGTPLYGPRALYSAIVWACATNLSPMPGRKALLLVSDGYDNSSNVKVAVAVKSALQSDTVIYVISLVPANPVYKETPSAGRDADRTLRELAKQTGGAVIPVRSQSEMGAAFEMVSRELRSQYALGYHSTKVATDGKLRKVRIQVTQKDLRVVTREGYYAPSN